MPSSHWFLGTQSVTHSRPSGVHDWPAGHEPQFSSPPQPSSSVPHFLPEEHCVLGVHAGGGLMHAVPSRLQVAPLGQAPPPPGGPQGMMPPQPSSWKPQIMPVGHVVAGLHGIGSFTQVLSRSQEKPSGHFLQGIGLPQSLTWTPHSCVGGQVVSQKQGTAGCGEVGAGRRGWWRFARRGGRGRQSGRRPLGGPGERVTRRPRGRGALQHSLSTHLLSWQVWDSVQVLGQM
jgi:hypothetical protein